MASTRFSQVSEGGLPYRRQDGQGNQCFKNLPVGYQNFHLEIKVRNRQKTKQDNKLVLVRWGTLPVSKKWSLTLLTHSKSFEHKEAP